MIGTTMPRKVKEKPKNHITILVQPELRASIEALASKERRSIAMMCKILLEQALQSYKA